MQSLWSSTQLLGTSAIKHLAPVFNRLTTAFAALKCPLRVGLRPSLTVTDPPLSSLNVEDQP
jgi:hypothetical protein